MSMNQQTMFTGKEPTGWIAWFVRNPVAANLLMISILIMGAMALTHIRTEGFPEPPPNSITVSVDFNGASPENVEEGAAIKVEEAIIGAEGVDKVISDITSDNATINIRGVDGYPLAKLKEMVKTRVDAISTFPDDVDTITITEAQEERHVLGVQIYGDAENAVLKRIAKQLRERLLALPSVNKVTILGTLDPEISIYVQEEKLSEYQIRFDDVVKAIQNVSVNISAGVLDTVSGKILIQNREQGYFGKEFEDIVIRSTADGSIVRVRDIARVDDGFVEQKILSRFQGKPSVNLDIELVGSSDSVISASNDVHEFLSQVSTENWLPETVKIAAWSDEADTVRDSLSLLSRNALLGMCLVVILLTLFLHPKVAFWVAIGIPVSFAGAFIVMGPDLLNYSINDLTIFAFIIVLGIVVDDAIIIGESIYSYKREHGSSVNATIMGAKKVATPATFGVLTTVAAFYPLTNISGHFGGPFKMIAVVTIICLLFSLIESKLILPAHLAKLNFDEDKDKKENILMRGLNRIRRAIDARLAAFIADKYTPMIKLAVRRRYQSLCLFLAILVLSIGLVTSGLVKTEFFGGENGSIVYAAVKMPSGTSADRTHQAAEHLLKSLDIVNAEIKQQYQLKGDPVIYSYASSLNDKEATVTVEIAQGSQRPFYSQDFLDLWQEKVGIIYDAQELSFYVDYEDSEDLSIELASHDYALLQSALTFLRERLEKYNGIEDIRSNQNNSALELSVQLKPHAELLGVNNRDVLQQIRNAIFGYEIQRLQRGDEEVKVKIRYPRNARNNITDLQDIDISLPNGSTITAEQITEISKKEILEEIKRVNGNRVLSVSATVDEDILSSSEFLAELEDNVFPELRKNFPAIEINLAGESEAEGEAKSELSLGFVLGLLLIYALLAVPLKSYTEPFIIMLAIPFGIIGAILGHLFISIPISLLSFFGILALSGVVVNDSLVLVSQYNLYRKEGLPCSEAVVKAGIARFRAVLLTSLTTFIGLVPLLQERSEQAQELIPMAVSLSFGILFATVITLFIIPVLLRINADLKALFRSRSTKKVPVN